MLDLSQALVTLAPQAAASLVAALRGWVCHPSWPLQLAAGNTSLAALARLASKVGVQSSTAFLIAAAWQPVFGVGRRVLAGLRRRWLLPQGSRAPRQPSSCPSLCKAQLAAGVGVILLLQSDVRSTAAMTFLRSTARQRCCLG